MLIKKLFTRLGHWYFTKKAMPYWAILCADCFIVVFTGVIMYAIDNGVPNTFYHLAPVVSTLCFYLLFYLLGFRLMHTYDGILRYSSFVDLYRVGGATFIGAALIMTCRQFFNFDNFMMPIRGRELTGTFFMATTLMWCLRLIAKFFYDFSLSDTHTLPMFIYGMKQPGILLAKELNEEKPRRYQLKGFVYDEADEVKDKLMGVHTYPNNLNLIDVMKHKGVKILMVSPLKEDALHKNLEMVNALIDSGVKIFLIRNTRKESKNFSLKFSKVKEVDIEDLLPRDEIDVDMEAVCEMLKEKVIMITGSAGSIGSEMVRQIVRYSPKKLVLIDAAETPLHDIRLELTRKWPQIDAKTIVSSICNATRMENIFCTYKPEYVFHAAAYKHVPMMEDNPSESILNNVNGTRIIADISVKYGVKKFVMISTDKAVNPTNVMGCSKRICEMYVQSLDKAIKEGKVKGVTQFVTTRFGNVLGSNGSVIPLFRQQIRNGGPVTVTHPNIIRYFMLIPEACKLVLEAGTMGKGGEIFVFDMGKPVKIADLARRMIKLSGANNIEIEYTGLRDGEKLYEEVLNDEEYTKPTYNSMIKISTVRENDYMEVKKKIEELLELSYRFDDMETVKRMKEMVPEFKSKHSIYESLDSPSLD